MDITDFLNERLKEREKESTDIGKIPSHLTREFREYIDDKEHLEKKLEIRKQELALEAEQKLKDEFDIRFEAINERHETIWEKIYQEMNIDPNDSYYYNRATNRIMKRTNNKFFN
jgi:hypothetical protein